MALPKILTDRLRIPVIASPLFIISNPELVIAQCKAGIIGSVPSVNARPLAQFEQWLQHLTAELTSNDAPFAVNLIVHKSNDRLMADADLCVKYRVPIVITSLGARTDINDAIHSYGGIVMHDVIDDYFAQKAIDKGADGLIPVAAGAGGHAGRLSPFALVQEIRRWFDGPVALSGAIATGRSILAAQAMGADLAYIGSAFIATHEANADERYKKMIVECAAKDILYSNLFTGVHGNYLEPSVRQSGLDPKNLPVSDPSKMDFGSGGNTVTKVWKDIWGCGQGIGAIDEIVSATDLIGRLRHEYFDARTRLLSQPQTVSQP